VDECKPLTLGCALRSGLELNDFVPFSLMPSYSDEVIGRGLHSSTFQLNLSRV
jgi:hypothetical protein